MPLVRLEQLQQFAVVNVLRDPGAIAGPRVVPNCAQISVQFALESGKVGHMVWTGRYTGTFAGTPAQATAIMTALTAGTPWSGLAAFLAAQTSLSAVTIRDINSPNQPIIASTGPAVPGTSASPSMPNEVALVVTLRTAKTGPQNRGRSYIPGWATNALGAGNVAAPAVMTALFAWTAVWQSALSNNGYQLVIGQPARAAYTGSTGRQHPARAATSEPVTALGPRDNHWDTQRRRGLK